MVVFIGQDEYRLRWINGQWRDEAGHVWRQNGEELSCREHGKSMNWYATAAPPLADEPS